MIEKGIGFEIKLKLKKMRKINDKMDKNDKLLNDDNL